jgi:hypothetical protein
LIAAVAVATCVSACSSNETHPPLLGNCVPMDGASCSTLPPGTGGGGPGGDASSEDAEVGTTEAGSCGVAVNYFQPPNPECLPSCIETVCCMGFLACISSVACQNLLRCAQAPCDTGSCLAMCEGHTDDTLAVVMAYDDLASCIASCNGLCPTLPTQASPGDL